MPDFFIYLRKRLCKLSGFGILIFDTKSAPLGRAAGR